jgi:shikimate kinase
MKNNGVVVFLDVPIGMLHFRLKNDTKRPLIASQENLHAFIESSLMIRLPIYNQADLIVDASLNKSELIEEIINFYLQNRA